MTCAWPLIFNRSGVMLTPLAAGFISSPDNGSIPPIPNHIDHPCAKHRPESHGKCISHRPPEWCRIVATLVAADSIGCWQRKSMIFPTFISPLANVTTTGIINFLALVFSGQLENKQSAASYRRGPKEAIHSPIQQVILLFIRPNSNVCGGIMPDFLRDADGWDMRPIS